MTAPVTLTGVKQAMPTPDPATGLIECNWIQPYVLNIPNSADPTDWMSGFYYVKLTGSSGLQQYIAFVVRDDARPSGKLAVRFSHVRRAAFLTADDQAQAIADIVQRVEHRKIALAGHAERELDSLQQQVVNEYAATGAHVQDRSDEKCGRAF